MYVSPLPVPANVGHTYTTYQPFMPHEYMYNHQRSYYTYNRGAGWTRTNVRYGTCCEPLQALLRRLALPDDEQHHGRAQRFLLPGPALVSNESVSAGGHAGSMRVRATRAPDRTHSETKMNRRLVLSLLAAAVIAASVAESFAAAPYIWPVRRSRYYDWNKPYAHTAYGQPVSLVVPPTATMQTNWGWGVGSSRLERLDHQFRRNYPGDGMLRRPVPHDADLAERHDAIRRVQRPRTVVTRRCRESAGCVTVCASIALDCAVYCAAACVST